MTSRRYRSLVASSAGLLALIAAMAAGCDDGEAPYALLLEVRAEVRIASLTARIRRTDLRERAGIFEPIEVPISESMGGYVGAAGQEPIRLRVLLPGPGDYLVHLVAEGSGGEVLTSTTCYRVDGVVVDRHVGLAVLPDEADQDGDTFPENADSQCAARVAVGFTCDRACPGALSGGLGDCNPDLASLPEGCPAPPEGVDPSINPLAAEICGNCVDEDCDGTDSPCPDEDGDGYPGGVDCDDEDPLVNPGAIEICGNGVDDNCRVEIEVCEGDTPCDSDGDGFFAANPHVPGCGGDDCDDEDPLVNPWAYEGCGADPDEPGACPGCDDGADNNCNGRVDEACEEDLDQDGLSAWEDCNDCDAGVGAGTPEVCSDGVDEDCDGADLPCPPGDGDHDGAAAAPSGDDCDDEDAHAYPGAPDRCGDGVAQDCAFDRSCDGATDADGDRFVSGVDCNDVDRAVNPWATEVCDADGVDEDCDGQVNEVLDPTGLTGCGVDETGRWSALDFTSDMAHCGGCRNACEAPPCRRAGTACVAGECRCGDEAACAGDPTDYCCITPSGAGECRDLTSVASCGACDRSCAQGEVCEPTGSCGLGECTCPDEGGPCPSDPCWACCPGVGCVDLCSTADHCGACDRSCTDGGRPAGDICSGRECFCGTAGTRCTGTTFCTDALEPEAGCGCADLDTDPRNCGACGAACAPGETCSSGLCACGASASCAGTRADYCCPPDGCVNLDTDPDHCGSCARACAPGETCVSGACQCGTTGSACATGLRCCSDGTCRACCGEADCSGGDHCCRDHACHDCCDDGDCGGGHCCDNSCSQCCLDSHCPSGQSCCPDGTCRECCDDGDCTAGQHCCSGTCRECCVDADCPTSRGRCCSGTCHPCCRDAHCSFGQHCCGDLDCHQCCNDGDCWWKPPWNCVDYSCE